MRLQTSRICSMVMSFNELDSAYNPASVWVWVINEIRHRLEVDDCNVSVRTLKDRAVVVVQGFVGNEFAEGYEVARRA